MTPEPGMPQAELSRMAILVCIGVFVTTIATDSRLAKLPLQSLLKDNLHVSPKQMAQFFFLVGIGWYLKPVAGILSDSVPFFGTRRRHYLLLSALLGAATWISMAFVPRTYNNILATMMLANALAVLGSTVIGGLLVDVGKQTSATGRLSSIRLAVMSTAGLIAAPIGGWFAAIDFRLTPITAATLMLIMGISVWVLMREPTRSAPPWEVLRGTLRQFVAIFTYGPLWASVGLTVLFYIAPGFNSLLFYYQKNDLHFSTAQIGVIGLVSGLAAVAGSLVYGRICSRFNLRTLLFVGLGINAASQLLYYAYRSQTAAYAVEITVGFIATLGLLPLYDLSARATPRGSEALGYSLLMSLGNLSIGLSDIFGTWLAERFHLKFMDMIWINAATTALVLIFIPFLPRVLVSQREGEITG